MKAFIFLSTDELIDNLIDMYKDIDDDDENYKRIYSQSMEEIQKYHKDYPYLVKTKRFGCWIV